MSTAAAIAVGDIVAGKYRVQEMIGEGAMGVVVAALHLSLERRVAIKVLWPHIAREAPAAERFRREALTAASIRGEHTCRVLDVGTHHNGLPYLVMEYLEGHSLAVELQRRGPRPYLEAVRYVLQACEALAEAHGLGVIHRDVKPANLFLASLVDGSRRIKVLDFGVSKSLSLSASGQPALTASLSFVGTPLYSSPEQLCSVKDLDARSDIWSLGVVLYELVTGRTPVVADSLAQLVHGVLEGSPAPPRQLGIDVPDALWEAIEGALRKRREERFGSVVEFAEALAPLAPEAAEMCVARARRLLRPRAHGQTVHNATAAISTDTIAWTTEGAAFRALNETTTRTNRPVRRRTHAAWAAVIALLVGGGHGLVETMHRAKAPSEVLHSAVAAPASSAPAAVPSPEPSHGARAEPGVGHASDVPLLAPTAEPASSAASPSAAEAPARRRAGSHHTGAAHRERSPSSAPAESPAAPRERGTDGATGLTDFGGRH